MVVNDVTTSRVGTGWEFHLSQHTGHVECRQCRSSRKTHVLVSSHVWVGESKPRIVLVVFCICFKGTVWHTNMFFQQNV